MKLDNFGFNVRKHFDERASHYDEDTETSDQADFANFEKIIPYLTGVAGNRILEVATGSGIVLNIFLAAQKDALGLDFSIGLLRISNEKREASKGRLICGDALGLPFQDNSFDAICVFRSLHHMDNPQIVLQEMLRCTRQHLFVYDCAGEWRRLVKKTLNKAHLYQPLYRLLRGQRDTGYRLTNEIEGPVKVFYAEDAIPILTGSGARITKTIGFPSKLFIHAEK